MPTAHINAPDGAFAADVIMPGDPLRARRIATEHLTDARLVSDVRGMLGYTGTYAGREISVMASGMGIPSATIYATELIRSYGVQRLVRVGTAGALTATVHLRDIVVAAGAHTDSAFTDDTVPGVRLSNLATFDLLSAAADQARQAGTETVHIGAVFSTDRFYGTSADVRTALAEANTLAVDMETAGLYAVAAVEGAQALSILTITDHLVDQSALSSDERETGFTRALLVALKALR